MRGSCTWKLPVPICNILRFRMLRHPQSSLGGLTRVSWRSMALSKQHLKHRQLSKSKKSFDLLSQAIALRLASLDMSSEHQLEERGCARPVCRGCGWKSLQLSSSVLQARSESAGERQKSLELLDPKQNRSSNPRRPQKQLELQESRARPNARPFKAGSADS